MYFSTGAELQAAINSLPNYKIGSFVPFDAAFYKATYMGGYAGPLSPIEHFVKVGAALGHKPNTVLDPKYYESQYADLQGKGYDAADLLIHFLRFGLDEGRVANPSLSSFNGEGYLLQNPDVLAYVKANLAMFGGSLENGAIAHYVKFGAAEGRQAVYDTVGVFTLKEIRTVETLPDTHPTHMVSYWGDSDTGVGVPAGQVWDTISAYLSTIADIKANLFDVNDSLATIEAITIEGVKDELQGDGSVDQYNGDVNGGTDADTGYDTGKEGDYTGNYQIRVTLSDGTINTAIVQLTQEQFNFLDGLLFDTEGHTRLFQKEVPYVETVKMVDTDGDGEGDTAVNVPVVIKGDKIITDAPIVLTPSHNNGGTEEAGYTTGGDDRITVGRLELLHGAYIDGGAGDNTLDIFAKGHFAQPKQLLNIQHINVENLPNVYTDVDADGNVFNAYPDVIEGGVSPNQNSILDLSSATDIESLTVTEGNFEGLNGQETVGSLTIAGIRNGVTTTLDGGFTQNVTLHYSDVSDEAGVNLVFHNLSMGDADVEGASNAQLNVAHNAETLNIESTGAGNYIASGNLGGKLSTLNITGDANLYIEGDLDPSFHDAHPAVIDASGNTGGVDLRLSDTQNVTFIGSQGNDRFHVQTRESDLGQRLQNDESVTIQGGVGDNYYEVVGADQVAITNGDGNNNYEITRDGGTSTDLVTITAGNGDNHVEIDQVSTAVLTFGNGDNRFDITSNISYDYLVDDSVGYQSDITITAGNGVNDINVEADSDIGVVDVTVGNGGNTVNVEAATIKVTAGTGGDDIRVEGRDITVNAGGTGNSITVVGTDEDYTDDVEGASNTGALIKINAGSNSVVNLGSGEDPQDYADDDFPGEGAITAKVGSSITGENLTLVVDTYADLRAATLSGVSKIILDDDGEEYDASDDANTISGADKALLTLTDKQVTQLVAAGVSVSVDGGIFNTSAHIKVIVTANLDVTTGAWASWLSALPANIDLQFEINDGAQLKIGAQQLHTKVAQGGITITNDGNTDQLSGKVLITGAGLDFDPFNNSDDARSVIDGRPLVGGSLATGTFGFAQDGGDAGTTIERGEWGFNVLIDRVVNGYNRPADAPSYSRLTINSDDQAGSIGPFDTIETFLRITGEADLAFTPVKGGIDDWGRPIEGGTAIELGVDKGEPTNSFMVDFSSAGGTISNLTLAHFQNADAVYGNGTAAAPARVNVEIDEAAADTEVGDINDGSVASSTAGLVSRGVQTYVVTDIASEDGEGASVQFWTSRVTENLEVLGLRGNYEDTITFGNTERGVDFLLEVAYDKFDGYAVGTLVADFARPGAAAVVNVEGLSTLPAGEVQKVAGINVTDAASATINVEGGNTVIESLVAASADDLILTADANLTIDTELPDGLESVDASGVDGNLSVTIDLWEANDTPLTFVGAAGSTSLTIDDAEQGAIASISGAGEIELIIGDGVGTDSADLSETVLTNVTGVVLTDGADLGLTFTQLADIGAGNIRVANAGDAATLTLTDLGEEPFSVADLNLGVGVNLNTVTILDQDVVTLHPDTDLTGIDVVIIPEGTTLNMTAEQFVQLAIDGGAINGDGTVNITDGTQADVDAALAAIAAGDLVSMTIAGTIDQGTFELVTDVELPGLLTGTLGEFEYLIGGNTLTLSDIHLADGGGALVAVPVASERTPFDGPTFTGGVGSAIKFTDTSEAALSRIDASGINVDSIEVLNVLVDNTNVDFMFEGLPARVTKVIYNDLGQVVGRVQNVVIQEGTTVPGALSFNDYGLSTEVTTLNVRLEGGTEIGYAPTTEGAPRNSLIVSTVAKDADLIPLYLRTLNIVSTGDAENLVNGETANVIAGNITPLAYEPAISVGSRDNNLKLVNISGDQELVIEGDIIFNSHGDDDAWKPADGITANDDNEATVTLNVNSSAAVTIQQLDISDADIDTLVVTNNGIGTLTVTGASPAIVTTDAEGETQKLVLSGTGDMVFGDDEVDLENDDPVGIDSNSLVSIDATGLLGDLNLGEIADVNSQAFSFKSGTGVTYIHLTGGSLNSTGEDTEAGNADDTAGWSFDYTGAAAGSQLVIDNGTALTYENGSNLTINMGANGVLFINGEAGSTVDLSALDLDITSVQDIVLADEVTLKLTAAQADGLHIVAGADTGAAGITAKVNIIDLGSDAVDLGGIAANITGTATLGADDVTLDAATDLGKFSITLKDAEIAGRDTVLNGQTIRFATAVQAEREIITADNDGNVVWLFNTITGTAEAGKVDTAKYDSNLGRLWVNDALVNGVNVEALWTTLHQDIIVRVVNTADLDELLPEVTPYSRMVEIESFTQLPGGLTFSDEDLLRSVTNLTIDFGGEVKMGDLNLDNVLGAVINPEDAKFDTLTLNSLQADSADHYLLPETWIEGVNPLPNGANVVGNISGGEVHSLTHVVINATDVDFEATGTITFTDDADNTATLELNGTEDVTIAAIDTSDADITDFVLDDSGFSGVLDPVMHLDNTETWTITNGSGDDDGAELNFEEVEGNELSVIDASDSAADINMVISQIDSDDDGTSDAFTFTAGTGVTNVTVQAMNGSTPTLESGSTWVFDFSDAAPGSSLIIDESTVLEDGANLVFDDANVTFEGDVDLSGVNIDWNGVSAWFVPEGSVLTLSVQQVLALALQNDVQGLDIVGGGTVKIVGDATADYDSGLDFDGPSGSGDGVLNDLELAYLLGLHLKTDTVDASGVTVDTETDTGGGFSLILGGSISDADSDVYTSVKDLTNAYYNGSVSGDSDAGAAELAAITKLVADHGDQLTQFITAMTGLDGIDIDTGPGTYTVHTGADLLRYMEGLASSGGSDSVDAALHNANNWDNIQGLVAEFEAYLAHSTGQSVIGSDNDDLLVFTRAAGEDFSGDFSMHGGLGNDVLMADVMGEDGSDFTYDVTSGSDVIWGLRGEVMGSGDTDADVRQDVLKVANGATAYALTGSFLPLPPGWNDFVATADTVNNGTAIIIGDGHSTIDVSKAQVGNGFTLIGGATSDYSGSGDFFDQALGNAQSRAEGHGGFGNSLLIGSVNDDTINGGNDVYAYDVSGSGDAYDTLTGNGGADTFVFNVGTSKPVATVDSTTTANVDRELLQITAVASTAGTFTVDYTVNGGVAQHVSVTVATTDTVEQIATKVVAAFAGITTMSATSGNTDTVTLTGPAGSGLTVTGITLGTAVGVTATANDGTDVAQVDHVAIGTLAGPNTVTAGEKFTLSYTLADGSTTVEHTYTANVTDGLTVDAVADGLVAAFAGDANVTVAKAVVGGVMGLDITDNVPTNGGFVATVSSVGAFSGSGASNIGATDITSADVITDFLSGTDFVQFHGLVAGTALNYVEVAEKADYTTALAAANTALAASAGVLEYYLTSVAPTTAGGTDGYGVLFFDANHDGAADGVVKLVGVDSDHFAATDIIAG